jgi:acylaminoacyl-peptidase
MLQAPVAEKTPQWGAPEDGPKDAAAPRSWRGVAAATEDWGELNTGKQAPSIYVLDTNTWTVHQVGGCERGVGMGCGVGSGCGVWVCGVEGNRFSRCAGWVVCERGGGEVL